MEFLIQVWESTDVKGQLYALFYLILYKRLEHLQILVSKGVLKLILSWIPGEDSIFLGSQKLYVDFRLHGGWHPNPYIVQASTALLF